MKYITYYFSDSIKTESNYLPHFSGYPGNYMDG